MTGVRDQDGVFPLSGQAVVLGHHRPAVRQQAGVDQEAPLQISLEEAYGGSAKTVYLASQGPSSEGDLQGREKRLDVRIPRGILPGQKIRLKGQGTQGPGGGPPGDLFLKVDIQPHPRFRLQGRDLYTDLALAPWEAAMGATVRLQSLNGSLTVKVPAGTQSGGKLRFKGKGMPNPRGTPGDLYAVARIHVPKRLSQKEKDLFKEMGRISSFNPRA